MHTLGKPQLMSLAKMLGAHHNVRIGLIGSHVYVFGAGKRSHVMDAIREHSKKLKAELHAAAAIKRAQASARQHVLRRA